MTVIKRTFLCPCGTWPCRIMRAGRVLALGAGIGLNLFIAAKSGLI